MGVKRLKIKNDLNYKKGRTWANCGQCDHFVPDFKINSMVDDDPGIGWKPVENRCRVIGLEGGRQFRIHPGNVCDLYDNTERIKRLQNMTDMAGVNRV